MARRLILDTGVLIASERGTAGLAGIVREGDDVVVAAVTVAELRVGVELASQRHRRGREEFLQRALEVLPVEPYDLAAAQAHGRLLAHVHRQGRQRGAHDLLVAATAVSTVRTLVTTDASAGFGELPGVTCLEISPQ